MPRSRPQDHTLVCGRYAIRSISEAVSLLQSEKELLVTTMAAAFNCSAYSMPCSFSMQPNQV